MTRGTVPEPDAVIARLRASNDLLRRELFGRRKVRWTVWAVVAVVSFAAGAAFGDTVSISGSTVTLAPSEEPGVVATVTFQNVALNGSKDDGDYPLSIPGVDIVAVFLWEHDQMTGADSITVEAPGFICEPANCQAVVTEGQSGQVRLMEWLGN